MVHKLGQREIDATVHLLNKRVLSWEKACETITLCAKSDFRVHSYFRLSYVPSVGRIQEQVIQGLSHLPGRLCPTEPDSFFYRENPRFLLHITGAMWPGIFLRTSTRFV